ncbi:helix-turn-helix transcriptional regulator [Pedobacter gandavensis]|uniref:response regulator transcription factor n=1 Tax=Pedobacter gandavensis TaxID=2679963 RepID=UPI00292E2DAF|nr:helix-turn-helix transcriptional regulator [Pedobacter gandavensis]
MEDKVYTGLLTRNQLREISTKDRLQNYDYLAAVESLARLTYESVYVIDYEKMSFEYVSENPLFLCGYSPQEVLEMGYEFYFKNVPEEDLKLLTLINDAGFGFFEKLPAEEKKKYSITYDFHLRNQLGKQVLVNHKLTPMFLTGQDKIWKAMCIVSISHRQQLGNVFIYKQGSDEFWELDLISKVWRKSEKPTLSKREIEILHLYAQGLTINQIAEKIFVAPDTVKYYRRRIFERLDVNNIVEALSYAVNNKII